MTEILIGVSIGLWSTVGRSCVSPGPGRRAERSCLKATLQWLLVLLHEYRLRTDDEELSPNTEAARNCRWPSLRWLRVDAISLPHRADAGPSRDLGTGVRVLSGRVQRCAISPGGGASKRTKAVGHRDSAPSDYPGKDHRRAWLARRGAQRGVGAVGQRLPSRMAQLLRFAIRQAQRPQARPTPAEVTQESSTIFSPYPQRVRFAAERAVVRGEGRRGASALVPRAAQPALIGNDHPRTRWPLLRELRRRCGIRAAAGPAARSRRGPGDRPVGDRRRHRHAAAGCRQPEILVAQAAQDAAPRAREVSTTEGVKQQGQDAAEGRNHPGQSGSCPAGLSPQAGFGIGSREPSDPCRRPQHCGAGHQPPTISRDQRCWVGAVRADHRREGGSLRSHRPSGVALAGVEQDLLDMPASARRAATRSQAVVLPGMPCGPRPRPQCRPEHSRRRAGGETKRLPRQWAGPCERFRWSPGKTSRLSGGTGR